MAVGVAVAVGVRVAVGVGTLVFVGRGSVDGFASCGSAGSECTGGITGAAGALIPWIATVPRPAVTRSVVRTVMTFPVVAPKTDPNRDGILSHKDCSILSVAA